MTPKEKAIELYNKFLLVACNYFLEDNEEDTKAGAKLLALIAVDEILNVACDVSDYDVLVTKQYWNDVKQEIEKL